LLNAGVEPLVLAFEVEPPVLVEVSVADDGAQGQDGLGTVQAPSRPADVKAVGDQVAARSLVIRGCSRGVRDGCRRAVQRAGVSVADG
jgi:hypothetical protein